MVSGMVSSFAFSIFGTGKNTVTVDIGPTIFGASLGIVGNVVGGGVTTSGFGIGAQYERQLLPLLSVAGRFAYLQGSLGLSTDSDDYDISDIRFSSYSIEAHTRFYPLGGAFFLNGMLGFANMSMAADDSLAGLPIEQSSAFSTSRNYFKLGAKVGWRFTFGLGGGFVLEPSFGYNGVVGAGSDLGNAMSDNVKKDFSDKSVNMLQNLIFVGGPRLSINLGWRF